MHSEKHEPFLNGASRRPSIAESSPPVVGKNKRLSSPGAATNRAAIDGQSDGARVAKPVTRRGRASVRRMRGVAPQALRSPARVVCHAAPVDATGTTVVAAAHSAAAGTVREACAEVALNAGNTRQPRIPSEIVPEAAVEKPRQIPGGKRKLPEYAGSFTDEVHRHADLVQIQNSLLNSKDEKIKQRSLERLLEMKYGKGAEPIEEAPQIVIDVARPNRIPKKVEEI